MRERFTKRQQTKKNQQKLFTSLGFPHSHFLLSVLSSFLFHFFSFSLVFYQKKKAYHHHSSRSLSFFGVCGMGWGCNSLGWQCWGRGGLEGGKILWVFVSCHAFRYFFQRLEERQKKIGDPQSDGGMGGRGRECCIILVGGMGWGGLKDYNKWTAQNLLLLKPRRLRRLRRVRRVRRLLQRRPAATHSWRSPSWPWTRRPASCPVRGAGGAPRSSSRRGPSPPGSSSSAWRSGGQDASRNWRGGGKAGLQRVQFPYFFDNITSNHVKFQYFCLIPIQARQFFHTFLQYRQIFSK